MKKKMFGIFICMLFLFSTLPTIHGSEILVNNEDNSSIKNKVTNIFIEIAYGRIKYNGEELKDEPWGMCYNITPINVKMVAIGIGEKFDFSVDFFKITDNPAYISQNMTRGYIGNHFMFLWNYSVS
jgi:hypothetical protein